MYSFYNLHDVFYLTIFNRIDIIVLGIVLIIIHTIIKLRIITTRYYILSIYDSTASELGFNSHKGDYGNSESLAKSIIECMCEDDLLS